MGWKTNQANISTPHVHVSVKQIPYPSYRIDAFLNWNSAILPLLLTMAFIYSAGMFTKVHVHVHVYTCMYRCTHVHVHVHIHTDVRICAGMLILCAYDVHVYVLQQRWELYNTIGSNVLFHHNL